MQELDKKRRILLYNLRKNLYVYINIDGVSWIILEVQIDMGEVRTA